MPPRTKQRANKKLGSQSYDRARFCGGEASTKFDDVWSNKPVVVERYWNIEQFRGEEYELFQNFEARQWLNVAHFHPRCVADIVREFFANAREEAIVWNPGQERITSWVRGVDIHLTPDDFASVFQIPRVQLPEFSYPSVGSPQMPTVALEILVEGQHWMDELRKPVSALNTKYWVLHMVSCTNLLPQNRNSDCSALRARLIYAIGTGMTIDLSSYIWAQIAHVLEHPSSQTGLPFGGALTEICRRKGARIPTNISLTTGLQPLTIVSVAKSRGIMGRLKKKRPNPVLPDEDSSSSDAEEEGGTSTSSHADLAAQIQDLSVRMTQVQRTQETHGHLLQTILDHLRDSHPPPPQ